MHTEPNRPEASWKILASGRYIYNVLLLVDCTDVVCVLGSYDIWKAIRGDVTSDEAVISVMIY